MADRGDVAPADTEVVEARSRRRWWLLAIVGSFVVVVGAGAAYVWSQIHPTLSAKYSNIAYTVPKAPRLVARSGERVYRIDPQQSSVGYAVNEKIFGQGVDTAHGVTNGIAGDIALNSTNPNASRVGPIVVNVEQLHSNNNLRDARMRASYLESFKFPVAQMTLSRLTGLPATLREGQRYHFTMTTVLTIKQTPAPVTWAVDASVSNGRIVADATTTVKMSTFHVGPISIVGFLSTSDTVKLTLHLTAVDPSKYSIPTTIAAPASARHHGTSPSFKQAILPVLEANCASCHNAGQVGAAHWKLDTAGDAASTSDGLASVVRSGYMPPWPASNVGVALAHSKRLDAKTVALLEQWSDAGGKLDVPKSTPVRPTVGPAGTPPRRDIVLTMPQPYTGSLTVPNDYRCFVLDPKITKPTWMTGFTVTPGHRTEIHHVQIFHIDGAQTTAALAISGKDGKPGWTCYGGPTLFDNGGGGGRGRHHRTTVAPGTSVRPSTPIRNFATQPGLIAGWVPGMDPTTYPLHSGILLQPGDALVLQIHYHYDRPPVPDRTTVAIQTEPGTDDLKPLDIINPIGPVEIPCSPGVVAPLCDRNAALADDAKLYGPAGSFIEQGLLLLCHKTQQELAATFKDGVASSSCDTTVPESGQIVGVLGHMHTLGKSFRLTLDPDTGHPTVLLDIPTWNFDWQMDYELAKPIHVEKGQTIRMQCSWDRSLDPNRPPKYIVFAEGTEDEMCFSTYAIVPDNP